MKIPMVNLRPALEATEAAWRERLRELFERQQFILGPQGEAFEAEFAAAVGARHCVAVGNGTAAIELCLREAGIGTGQEVIAPALTAPFTGIGIVSAGCRVRFADIDPETLLLDVSDAAGRMGKRTAAVVAVHLYGQPCDLAALRRVCGTDVVLVQDACQAHGAEFRGKPLTAYSRHVAYSFYPTKNLGALGDGGAVTTSSAGVAARLRRLRDGGRRGGQVAFVKGINSRLDEMQAAYLRAFLPKLGEWNAERARMAAYYRQALRGCGGVRMVETSDDSVHHLFVIRARRRDKLRQYLAGHGIGTAVHYPVPLHLMPAFRECGLKRGDLPHAERECREIVSLPLWPYLGEERAAEVAGRIVEFYGRRSGA